MAVDHGLATTLPEGCGRLRFYQWSRPTVSLGRNEPAAGLWDRARMGAAGVDLVRRPTGGRAVFHHRELTYAVIVPAGGPGSMRSLYHTVNRALVNAFRGLGVAASCAPRKERAAPLDAGPCFEVPAEGEVVVEGRKLVGSAQVRLEGRLLQHGSVLIGNDQPRLADFGPPFAAPVPGGITSLEEWLSSPLTPERLGAALRPAFEAELGGDWHCADTHVTLGESLRTRLEAHYRSSTWSWRR